MGAGSSRFGTLIRLSIGLIVNRDFTTEHDLYLKLFITNGGGW